MSKQSFHVIEASPIFQSHDIQSHFLTGDGALSVSTTDGPHGLNLKLCLRQGERNARSVARTIAASSDASLPATPA